MPPVVIAIVMLGILALRSTAQMHPWLGQNAPQQAHGRSLTDKELSIQTLGQPSMDQGLFRLRNLVSVNKKRVSIRS